MRIDGLILLLSEFQVPYRTHTCPIINNSVVIEAPHARLLPLLKDTFSSSFYPLALFLCTREAFIVTHHCNFRQRII